MIKKYIFLSVLIAVSLPPITLTKELNCSMSQQSNFIDDNGKAYPHDIYVMSDSAANKAQCEKKCREYSAINIEPNAHSFHSIGWKCFFNEGAIADEIVKESK